VWWFLFRQCGGFCSDSVVVFVPTVWWFLFRQCGGFCSDSVVVFCFSFYFIPVFKINGKRILLTYSEAMIPLAYLLYMGFMCDESIACDFFYSSYIVFRQCGGFCVSFYHDIPSVK
jgi:hypothetical protein